MTFLSNKKDLRGRVAAGLIALVALSAACGGGEDGNDAQAAGAKKLVGLFRVESGECAKGEVTKGSYFRMIQSGGALEDGPFVTNTDSPCGDQGWTPMFPGSDGGLSTVDYQAAPKPPFDGQGNGKASAIVEPTPWFGVAFAIATNPTDPQMEVDAAVPTITVDSEGNLSGDVGAYAAAWNEQHFNQGAPKPDGSKPGNTTEVTGTYDESTGRFVMEWTSQIVGGPFDKFTGVWHLEGTFEAK